MEKISPEEATKLASEWGAILLLNVPKEMHFGIDHQSWDIGEKFKGIKMIPPGAHYIYYSLKEEDHLAKMGFFLFVKPQQILCRRWDEKNDKFVRLEEEEEKAYSEGVRNHDFDCNLGPYPLDRFSLWRETTNFISEEIISRIEPIQKFIPAEETKHESLSLYFTDIPHFKSVRGMSAEEITKANFDCSSMLLSQFEKESDLLGELQFSFVGFMLGENMDCFEHWKRLIVLICSSESAVMNHPGLFLDFIPVFYSQLKQLPEEFFICPMTSNSFLKTAVQNLHEFFSDPKTDKRLINRSKKFFKLLKEQFNLNPDPLSDLESYSNLQLIDSEDMPVIVNPDKEFFHLY